MSQSGLILMNYEQGVSTCYKCQYPLFLFFFFFLLSLCKPAPTERLLLSAWLSAWLEAAKKTVWRTDWLKMCVGLSAGFIRIECLAPLAFQRIHSATFIFQWTSHIAGYQQQQGWTNTNNIICLFCSLLQWLSIVRQSLCLLLLALVCTAAAGRVQV